MTENINFETSARAAAVLEFGTVLIAQKMDSTEVDSRAAVDLQLIPLLEEGNDEMHQSLTLDWEEFVNLVEHLNNFIESVEDDDDPETSEKVDSNFKLHDIVYVDSYNVKAQIEDIDDNSHDAFYVRIIEGFHRNTGLWVGLDDIGAVTS